MLKSIWIIVLLALFPNVSHAQELSEAQKWAEDFLSSFIDKDPEKAHDILLKDTWIGEKRPHAIMGIKEQLIANQGLTGDSISYKLLREDILGERTVVLYYVLDGVTVPTIWQMTFYKQKSFLGGGKWRLIQFSFNSDPGSWNELYPR